MADWGTPPNDDHNGYLETLDTNRLHAIAQKVVTMPRGVERKANKRKGLSYKDTIRYEDEATSIILQLMGKGWTTGELNSLHSDNIERNLQNLRQALAYASNPTH